MSENLAKKFFPFWQIKSVWYWMFLSSLLGIYLLDSILQFAKAKQAIKLIKFRVVLFAIKMILALSLVISEEALSCTYWQKNKKQFINDDTQKLFFFCCICTKAAAPIYQCSIKPYNKSVVSKDIWYTYYLITCCLN